MARNKGWWQFQAAKIEIVIFYLKRKKKNDLKWKRVYNVCVCMHVCIREQNWWEGGRHIDRKGKRREIENNKRKGNGSVNECSKK